MGVGVEPTVQAQAQELLVEVLGDESGGTHAEEGGGASGGDRLGGGVESGQVETGDGLLDGARLVEADLGGEFVEVVRGVDPAAGDAGTRVLQVASAQVLGEGEAQIGQAGEAEGSGEADHAGLGDVGGGGEVGGGSGGDMEQESLRRKRKKQRI